MSVFCFFLSVSLCVFFFLYYVVCLMLMTHLPETRASNPALGTRKCDMLLLFSADFISRGRGNLARYSAMLYSTLESGVNGAL